MNARARSVAAVVAFLVAPGPWPGQGLAAQEAGGALEARAGDIVAANLGDHSVSLHDGTSGAFRGYLVESGAGGLRNATGVAFGPDGRLYVGSSGNGRILRYDGRTGAFVDVFASGEPLGRPFSLVFGPGGDLFVSSEDAVLRYDGRSGSFAGYAARDTALQGAIGLAFDDAGLLYVVSSRTRTVLRFDPGTGVLDRVFAADSLRFPSDVTFGPEGDLWVSSAATASVLRFDGASGALRGTVATLPDRGVPVGLAFDARGRLLIGGFSQDRLYRLEADGTLRMLSEEGLARPENIAVKR